MLNENKQLSLGRAAVCLAMTESRDEEDSYKEIINNQGFKAVATEVSGKLNEILSKIIKNAVTAALNTNLIANNSRYVHAINHAVLEAMHGIVTSPVSPNPSLKLKISVVTDGQWVAVGIYGYSALHFTTNQEKCGLGVMHL